MVEGGARCIKYLLFAFNLIFCLAGLVIFIVAIVVQVKFNEYASFFGTNNTAVGLIIIGAIIMIIAFFGCCGAYKENYCMVLTFAILLTIILILEVIFVILVYTRKDEVVGKVDDGLKAGLANYNKTGGPYGIGVKEAWDTAQQEFECCGARNYSDWRTVLHGNVPDSCCRTVSDNCGRGIAERPLQIANFTIYTQGCIASVEDYMAGNLVLLGSVGIALILIQVFVVIFSCCLAHSIRKEYEVV